MNRQPKGTTLVAVDIDVKNGSTFNALTQNRCWSTATAIAITPNGGTHFLLLSMARSTCGFKHPAQGIAPAPAWLNGRSRRLGCVAVTGHRSGRRARTARSTSTWHRLHGNPFPALGDPSGRQQPPSPAC